MSKPAPSRSFTVPLASVLGSMAALWAVHFGLTTARGFVMGLGFESELVVPRLVVAVAGIAVTFLVYLALRPFEKRSLAFRLVLAAVIALPGALMLAQINQFAFAEVQAAAQEKAVEAQGGRVSRDATGNLVVEVPRPGEDGSDAGVDRMVLPAPRALAPWRQVIDIALNRYFLLLAWASLYAAMVYAAQTRQAERREGEFRKAAKAAELRSLRYQVNPHFLFNTLNSLSALVITEKTDRAEAMIQSLSAFYRRSLADDPSADVSLADEFEFQRLYLDIESVRFPERLRSEMDLPEELADARVPGLILQPLVENSVRYAVSPVNRPVCIRIAARAEHGELVLTVSDDGPGASGTHGTGIGLTNVRDRLAARFGGRAGFTSGPTEKGYRSIIRIPLEAQNVR